MIVRLCLGTNDGSRIKVLVDIAITFLICVLEVPTLYPGLTETVLVMLRSWNKLPERQAYIKQANISIWLLFSSLMIILSLIIQSDISFALVAAYGPGQRSRYSESLRTGRSGDLIPVEAIFSVAVQAGPGVHPASCTIGTVSLSWGQGGRGVALTTHTNLAPTLKKEKSYTSAPSWVIVACSRVNITFTFVAAFFRDLKTKTFVVIGKYLSVGRIG
jgi:hypothetical protein